MSRAALCLVFVVCVISAGHTSPATQNDCADKTKCTVTGVDITPCAKKSSCRLKRGQNATINFNFTPDFAATELETDVSYLGQSFNGLERNACLFTTCPVSKGVEQPLSYNLYLHKRLPPGDFQIKWKVWNKADASELCCFETNINIKK